MPTRVVDTSFGQIEVALAPGGGKVVLCFPGGHATAVTPLCAGLYAELGYRPLTFSRPGYGLTDVGELTAAESCRSSPRCASGSQSWEPPRPWG
jgi:hypothetical protein